LFQSFDRSLKTFLCRFIGIIELERKKDLLPQLLHLEWLICRSTISLYNGQNCISPLLAFFVDISVRHGRDAILLSSFEIKVLWLSLAPRMNRMNRWWLCAAQPLRARTPSFFRARAHETEDLWHFCNDGQTRHQP
jgi:hypothetical protein